MTKQEADFIGSMNMCDEISNEAYKKIMCNCEVEEQEPCEDCISREDAKNLFWDGTEGYDCRGFTRMEIGEMLDDLPSVTPQQAKWIPVSERLPEENIHVLCQFYMGGMAECYHAHDYWHIVGGFRIKIDDVLAWMPLPQPYRESEDKK